MEQDKIGRKDIVEKICGLVDSLQKNKNFCLALNGAWGSGKSFVMEMIEEKLKTHKEYLIVKYDAWKNNFYPDPLIAILYCVLDSIKDNLHLVADRKIKKLIKSVCKHTAKKAIDEIISYLHKQGGKHAIVAFVVEIIINVIKQAKSSILDNKLFDDYKSYQSLLSESIEVLNALTAFEDYNDKQTRLVILVDEVDRCLPDEQLKVLERLHHLFNVKNCAVIVAINKESVYKNFDNAYGGDGKEYLRKFFDLTYFLNTNANLYLKSLIFENFVKYIESIPQNKEMNQVLDYIYNCIYENIRNNPKLNRIDNRRISNYYECVEKICGIYGWEKLNVPCVFCIFIAVFIKRFIQPLFLVEEELKSKNVPNYFGEYFTPKETNYRYDASKGGYPVPILNYFNRVIYSLYQKQDYEDDHITINKELREIINVYGGEDDPDEK